MSWPVTSLGSACLDLRTGPFGSLLHKADYIDGGIPLVNPMHISDGIIVPDTRFTVTSAKAAELARYRLDAGHVVMGRRGEMGRCAVVSSKSAGMICGTGSMIIIPDPDKLDPQYAALLIRTDPARRFFENVAAGVTMLNLNPSAAAKLRIPLPPLPEQRRIVAILDQADALRRLRRQSLCRFSDLGQATFFHMFGDWSSGNAQWDMVELGDKLDFLTSGSRGWAEHYADAGPRFIRIQNVRRGYFDWADLAHVNAPDSAEARRTKVQRGDVLLSITADLGRVAVVPDAIGAAHINQHLAILRTSFFNPHFLAAMLTSPTGQRTILKKDRSAVKSGLNFDDIRSLRLIAPPREMQDEFENRLKRINVLHEKYIEDTDRVDSLFASLQHRAFRGEL